MPDPPPAQRPSDVRRQRKQANHDAMVDAAVALFASVGYLATTMEAVASRSGMSVQSVYFAFHSKANLVQAALDRATPPPLTHPAEQDPDVALTFLVDGAVRSLEAIGALAIAVSAAAPGDAAVTVVRDGLDRRHAQAALALVHQLRGLRPLARGVTARRAADVVYGLLSPQLHAILVRDRGWTTKRYAAWSADSIGRALWG